MGPGSRTAEAPRGVGGEGPPLAEPSAAVRVGEGWPGACEVETGMGYGGFFPGTVGLTFRARRLL